MVLCSKGMEQLLGGGAESEEDASRTVFFSPFRFCSSVVLHFACSIEVRKQRSKKRACCMPYLPSLSLSIRSLCPRALVELVNQTQPWCVFPRRSVHTRRAREAIEECFFPFRGIDFPFAPLPFFLLTSSLTQPTLSFSSTRSSRSSHINATVFRGLVQAGKRK